MRSFRKNRPIVNFTSNLFFPPKCMNCGEILDFELLKRAESPLCDTCRLAWERAKASFCSECGYDMKSCTCMPKTLRRADCSTLLKLISYKPNGAMPTRKFLFSVKHRRNKATFSFLAEQMRFLLIAEMRRKELSVGDCVICYLPRSYQNKSLDGFDQARALASELSRQTGIELSCALKRRMFTKEEKKLNKVERQLNMSSAFRISDKRQIIRGKTVILLDDVVTTGSGMAAATRLCLSAGAFEVMGICIGYTDKNDKKTNKKD